MLWFNGVLCLITRKHMKNRTSKTKTPVFMKFEDMPSGTHFKDGHDRKFIKLQNPIPSGLIRTYFFKSGDFTDTFNSVDYKGCTGKCPGWCVFEII